MRDVAGQLDMLLLVVADRHVGRLVEQDVGGLQHRIGEQADARALAVLARLLLELGHAVEPAHARGAAEDPGQLGVRRHRAWANRIDLSGSIPLAISAAAISRTLERSCSGIDVDRQRVEVGEEEQALGLVLHPHPAQDRAEQIAEVEVAGRLDAGNDAHGGLAQPASVYGLLRRSSDCSSSLSMPPSTQTSGK